MSVFGRSRVITAAFAVFATLVPTCARPDPLPASAYVTADCAHKENVTLTGHVPFTGHLAPVEIMIAPVNKGSELVERDMAAEIVQMSAVNGHLDNQQDYALALAHAKPTTTMPTPAAQTFAAVDAAMQRYLREREAAMNARQRMITAVVDPSGNFHCGGFRGGTYMVLVTERQLIPTTKTQSWLGPYLPNSTMYEIRVRLPETTSPTTIPIQGRFTQVARFMPR